MTKDNRKKLLEELAAFEKEFSKEIPENKEGFESSIDFALKEIPKMHEALENNKKTLEEIKELLVDVEKNKFKIVGLLKQLPWRLIHQNDYRDYTDLLGVKTLKSFHVDKLSRDNYEAVKRSKDVPQEEIDEWTANMNEKVENAKQFITDKFNFSLTHAPSHGVALELLKARLLKEVYDNSEPGKERDAKLKIVEEITLEDIKSLYIRAEE